jgi:hypothetical protein
LKQAAATRAAEALARLRLAIRLQEARRQALAPPTGGDPEVETPRVLH